MEISDLKVNQVVHDSRDGNDYRILWMPSSDSACGYWIRVNSSSNIPSRFLPSELAGALDKGLCSFAMDTYSAAFRTETPNEKALKYRDRAWSLIRDMISSEPGIYEPSSRAELLRSAEQSSGVKVNNLYKYLGRYWRLGMTPNALLPNYSACGQTRDVYKATAKRSGRKKPEGADGKKLVKEDLKNFRDAVDKYYLGGKKLSFEETYRKLKEDHYTVRDKAGNPISPMPHDDVPSRQQFIYWYRKNRNVLDEARKRGGERAYQLGCRGETGRTETSLYGPGIATQIDATTADIYLVSSTDRSAIIGRPTMYFLMDSYSHIVTGMNISLDPPSWNNASAAVINAVQDKVSYCRKYGVEITKEDWPCMHIPSVLLADRGEVESRTADILATSLGITIENAPPYRGDLKGIIEKHFDLINLEMDKMPGNVKKDFGQRCTEDYRLNATLDIFQFTAIIIRCVLTYNNYHYMADYRRDPQMRQLKVNPVPRDLWNYGIRYQTGGLRTMPYEQVRYSLLPKQEASVTRRGIHCGGLYYTCEPAEKEKWFDIARTTHSWKVTAAYDPSDAALIYISPNAGGAPIECHLLDREWMYEGLTQEEAARQNTEDNRQREAYRKTEDFARLKLDEFIDSEIGKAKALSPEKQAESKAKRIARIDANRRKEKEQLRQSSADQTLKERGYSKATPEEQQKEEETVSPITKMLQEALNEVLNKEGNADDAPG